MCGIVAAVGNISFQIPNFSQALNNLKLRGPDAEGIWFSKQSNVKIGHRRLSINDLSEMGNQPFSNESETIWLACNGEIYNYWDLRNELEKNGHFFQSNSDNEAIIHAYEEWGLKKCLDKLYGMFSFVLWDENLKTLFAARDHVGIKPLCYAELDNGLIISSDFSGLLPLLPEKPDPDPVGIAYVLSLGYIPSPYSIWKGTKKLEPGHWLEWNESTGLKKQGYWSPPNKIDNSGDYSDEQWKNLFEKVLAEHMLSDVPVGLFLSGGLDSTAIALGLKNIKKEFRAMTIAFPGSSKDEEHIAKKIANEFDFLLDSYPLTEKDIGELMEKMIKKSDEPHFISSALPYYRLSENVSKNNYKVVLGGDGGDECFGGYKWHRIKKRTFFGIESLIGNIIALLSKKRLFWTSSLYFNIVLNNFITKKMFLYNYIRTENGNYFHPNEISFLLKSANFTFNYQNVLEPFERYDCPTLPSLRRFQRIDLMNFCADHVNTRVDRMSMCHSLEVRVPFLDRRVIEYALKMPQKTDEISQQNSKPLLRNYLKNNHAPDEVLSHPKLGFSMRFLDKYDNKTICKEIDNGWLVQNGYLNKQWRDIVNENIPNYKGKLLLLYSLTKWSNHWI